MAPVEIHTSPSLIPILLVALHHIAVGYVSFVAGRSIYRSYVSLPPSSATRYRESLRKGHVRTFFILALVSLAFALYYASRFGSLSYRVWATERGIELPQGFFGDKGALRGGEHPGRLQLVQWLNDTPLYRDALEIVTEKARHFWWGQQVNLGLISWSLYLAIEGQRRNVSNLWSFWVLSQLVNLSYAQNLFFVAVLLTPVPLPENVREITRASVPGTSTRYGQFLAKAIPAKPEGWVPSPYSYATVLALSFFTTLLVPFAANTPSFMTIMVLSRTLPFSFLALPYVIPESWGIIHSHPHDSHATFTRLFQYVSIFSAILHLKSSFLALFYLIPDGTYYRHSLLHPFKEEQRTALERGTTALGRVFGAIGEHPAVSAQGWDVVLSGLTLGIWAAVRGLDASDLLKSTVPFIGFTKHATEIIEDTSITVGETARNEIEQIEQPIARRRPGRPKKQEDSESIVPKRRGRSAKKALELTNGYDEDDTSYEPTESEQLEGDDNVEEDWEMGALAWGLLSVGGLGVGTSAVYSAEVVAR